MKLNDIKNKCFVKVIKINESNLINIRLCEFGINCGSIIKVLKNHFGTVIIEIDSSKFLINQNLAKNIEVIIC
ncbi:MAG: hypothetical protein K1060chlam5_00874 [Candidatus Anoxychlamydiales bacterium]|nr:hypothetical protein [Candidatus Anoxychlamydiales bacterium]